MQGINIGKQLHSLKILASQIKRELETQTEKLGHCAIYEEELQRIWPLDEENRERKIAQFAREYGFHLSLYRHGLCAIFVKEAPTVSV
jgi:hypothetical protein